MPAVEGCLAYLCYLEQRHVLALNFLSLSEYLVRWRDDFVGNRILARFLLRNRYVGCLDLNRIKTWGPGFKYSKQHFGCLNYNTPEIFYSRMQGLIKTVLLSLLLVIAGCNSISKQGVHYEMRLQPGVIAAVSEGSLEPRSIGSYSLRVYSVLDPEFPYDNFVTGIINPRDGVVQKPEKHDIDGDDVPEIIVVIRSAGSGTYLSANAYRFKDDTLSLVASVSNLTGGEDLVQSLIFTFTEVSDE